MKNLDSFMSVYAEELEWAVTSCPSEYGYPVSDVPGVVERMRAAIVKGTYNHDGRAFRSTCKKLGIKHTRKAIAEYLAC